MLKHSFENLRNLKGEEKRNDFPLKVDIPKHNSLSIGRKKLYGSPTSIAAGKSRDSTPRSFSDDLSACSSGNVSECEDSISIGDEHSVSQCSEFHSVGIAKVHPLEFRPISPTDGAYRSPQQLLKDKYRQQYLHQSGLEKL